MAVILRDARPDEAAAIGALLESAYGQFADRLSPENWQALCTSLHRATALPGVEPIVAEVEGRLAGQVGYFPPGRSDGVLFPRDWASMRLLGVAPWARGQ